MSGSIFHVVTSVWGDGFIDLFLTTAIPNQLTTGNLESLPQGSRYRILTSARDLARLEAADAVRALRAVLPVDIVAMDDGPRDNAGPHDVAKYHQMIAYHRRAFEDAFECGATLIILAPDHVLATQTMARLVELRAQGYRAVVCPGIRLSKEPMLEALAGHGRPDLPPRTLVGMALRHLHRFTLEHMADAEPFSRLPTFVYWRVNDGGLLARCLNLHSLMIDPVRRELPKGAPDGRYLFRAVPDLAAVYVVTDSDDLVIFELTTTRNIVTRGRRSWPKDWRTASVAFRCDAHQIAFWQRSLRFHSGDLSDAWVPVELEAARFADRVIGLIPYVRHMFPMMNRIRRWQQRCDHLVLKWRRRLPRARQVKRSAAITLHRARKQLRREFR